MNRTSLLALALIASMADGPPTSAEVSVPSDTGHQPAMPLDRLPPTRKQQSADFRSSPGSRQRKRRKAQRQGGGR